MQKIIEFEPAYDKRDPDPSKDYGIHGVNIRFVLKGAKGAVQFLIYTGWLLPATQKEFDTERLVEGIDDLTLRCFYKPKPVDLGVHSKEPMYEGQHAMGEIKTSFVDGEDMALPDGKMIRVPKQTPTGTFSYCDYTDGKCYYDGSGLAADPVFDILLEKGSDGVWDYLQSYYEEVFKEKP